MWRSRMAGIGIAVLTLAACDAYPGGRALSRIAVIKPNAGWCWFHSHRVLHIGRKLFFGSVAGANRAGSDRGDVEVVSFDLGNTALHTYKVDRRLQTDDHVVPGLLELPDRRLLASWSTHFAGKATDLMRWRVSMEPGDVRSWAPLRTLAIGDSGTSYSNLYLVRRQGHRVYNFHRGLDFNPNYLVSDDRGSSFRYGGKLLHWPPPAKEDPRATPLKGGRPYVIYAGARDDTVHLVTSEDHPRSYDNSIYHAYLRDGRIYHSDGSEIAPLATERESAVRPTDLTTVFQGDDDHVAWPADLQIDAAGNPVIAFSVQRSGAAQRAIRDRGGEDHRYYYARWHQGEWNVSEMAHAGSRLSAREVDYTGLVAIDPSRTGVVYISTDADPVTGEPLRSNRDGERHHEIFRGVSTDGGASWSWDAVTAHSTEDQIRPVMAPPPPGQRPVLLWLRGRYDYYTDYDLDAVGLVPGW